MIVIRNLQNIKISVKISSKQAAPEILKISRAKVTFQIAWFLKFHLSNKEFPDINVALPLPYANLSPALLIWGVSYGEENDPQIS